MKETPTTEKDAEYERGWRDALNSVARLAFSTRAREILRPLSPDARCYDPRCKIAEHDHSTSVIPPEEEEW